MGEVQMSMLVRYSALQLIWPHVFLSCEVSPNQVPLPAVPVIYKNSVHSLKPAALNDYAYAASQHSSQSSPNPLETLRCFSPASPA